MPFYKCENKKGIKKTHYFRNKFHIVYSNYDQNYHKMQKTPPFE